MKKKVMRMIARLNIGGPAIHVILLTSMLNSERYESILVTGKEGPKEGNMLSLAREKGVEPLMVPSLGRELHPLRDLITLWKLYWLIRREKPDIVHTHTAKAGTVGRLAAWLAGVPVIIHTFHGHVLHGYFSSWKNSFFRSIERFLARRCSRVITVSECCRQDLLRYNIGTDESLRTIYLGLELEKFRLPDEEEVRQIVRQQYEIPQEAFVVGIVARLVPIKRHEVLFQAVPKVLREYPETYFVIVGDGELRESLEQLAQRLNIAHCCIFCGFRNDPERVYAAFDLTVLTSGNEGLPVTVIESLASGKAVVATEVGGVPELIEEGKNGYIVEKENPDSVADGIIKAVADPEKTKTMGKNAQDETIRKFSSQRLMEEIDSLYQEVSIKTASQK